MVFKNSLPFTLTVPKLLLSVKAIKEVYSKNSIALIILLYYLLHFIHYTQHMVKVELKEVHYYHSLVVLNLDTFR